ncbi:la-related protein 1C [Gastrolobium bilobum]|uniref:la-related protein 1C n=1 Tax=Gastrolobium bilobum TaxID=150636 RepID=UPI002AB1FD5B|nr:la-related protein 1C [Gastrolobium bilobum]
MAMTGNHSSDNPQSRRATRLPVSSSPWNQIVRGESETVAAAPSSPPPPQSAEPSPSSSAAAAAPVDDSSSAAESSDNGNSVKRPVWNKPSNGAASEVTPVMDAVSWPALSESTRAAMKSESSKGLLDGSSVPQLQGMGSTPSSSSQRQVSDNASTNNMVPTRQKSFRHNSSNASSNGGHPQKSAPQVSIAATGSHNSSPKDHAQRSGFVSNDHPQQRNSFRNRNGGPHQRGDGAHHHNYGNRRDQDWNTHRNFNGRDAHMPPRVVPRFIRPPPPPNSAQFIHPPPVRPFGSHIGFHELVPPMVFVAAPPPPLDSLRGAPFVPPMPHHALFYTGPPDPQLHTKIVNQIDYYFSNENLIRDTFLRRNMDDQGWVPIKLIAGFNKVMHLTDNIQLIIDAVRTSSVVELQGDKIRRRNDWGKWVMPPVQFSNVTGSQTLGVLNPDMLAEQVRHVKLVTTDYDGAGGLDVLSDDSQHRSAFGDLNNSLQLSTSEGTGQVGIQGSDHFISARN